MGSGELCGGCSLEKIGAGFTAIERGARYESTRLLVIAEASGENEAREGLPLRPHAQAGSLFADALRQTNISRSEIAITNVLRCRPPKDYLEGAYYQYSATNHCITNYLIDAIRELQPRVILALGGTAMRALTMAPKGKYGGIDYIRGFVQRGSGAAEGIPVLTTYHTAHLRRGKAELTPLLHRDMRRAFLIATGKLVPGLHYAFDPMQVELKYQMTPTVGEAWEWYRGVDTELPIFFDIETPRSSREDEDDRVSNSSADRDINLCQFTQRAGEGIAVPFREEYRDVARAIMALPNLKVSHNGLVFDLEVMGFNDFVVNGEVDDTMVMWGRYQPDLPANLQAVAGYFGFPFNWKHLADSEQEFYGICDVDALARIYYPLKAVMEREGLWGPYVRYFRRFWSILRDMSHRGLPISEDARLELKAAVEREEIEKGAEIQHLVPPEVLSTKQKNGLKNPPILACGDCEFKGRVDHFCPDEGGLLTLVPYADLAEENGLVLREIVIGEEEKCRCAKSKRAECDVCGGLGFIPAGVVESRWAAPKEFNPNSSFQVKRYMKFKRHPVPKHAKRTDAATGESAETTEVKELERLFAKTKDPIYPKLIELRQLSKIMGTYVEGWGPGKDGRIHSTFTYRPATWQTSSKSPNCQNGLKRGKSIAQKARVLAFNKMQRAEDGYLLVNFDAKSFHAQTTACEAGLPDYLRLAKIDIHSFNACHFIKHSERFNLLTMSDADLKGFFKEMKKSSAIWTNGMTFKEIRDGKTKSAGLGIGFGMRGKKLYKTYEEDFASQAEAEAIWNLIMRELFPGLLKWQEEVKHRAHEEKILVSKFGAIRRFFDVERWDRRAQKMMGGDQAEAAIAFLPAANAFGDIRDMLITLDDMGALERFQLANSVHDSLVFHCPVGLVDECVATVVPVMEAPNPTLTYKIAPLGLDVEAEASVGPNLSEMEEVRL